MTEHTYSMVPYTGYGMLLSTALLLLPVVLLGYLTYSARTTTFIIAPAGLDIRGGMYGRFIPATNIKVDEVRTIPDLDADPNLKLSWKRNGVGLPGYKAGWFSTKSAGKALVFLTDRTKVAAVPTTEDYVVLVSVSDPDSFVRQLRESVTKTR